MLIWLVLLLLLADAAGAQEEAEWTAYTSMRSIEQVLYHAGQIWSATSGGVLRYDPRTGEYGRLTRLQGLAGNRVLSVAADGGGDLWFGTDGQGLSRLRRGYATCDPPFLAFADLRVQALASVDHRVFVGTDQGVSLFLGDDLVVKETYLQLGDFPKGTGVRALAVSDGVLWAGTDEGVAWVDLSLPNLQDPGSWRTWSHAASVEDVLALDGRVLCATGRGVFLFQPETGTFFGDFASIVPFTALGTWEGVPVGASVSGDLYRRDKALEWRRLAIEVGRVGGLSRGAGSLWIGTEDGLRSHGGESPVPPEEPPANQFYEMALPGDGSLWMASVPSDRVTPALGLYRLYENEWEIHDRHSGLPSDVAISLATDEQGRMWVGTWGHGLAVRDHDGSWQNLTWSNSALWGIRDNNRFVVVSDIQRDADGLMWLANVQAGLVVMDGFPPKRSRRYSQQELGLEERRDIGKITVSPNGLKWISTSLDGFLLFDDGGTPFSAGDESVVHVNTRNDERLSSDRVSDLLLQGEELLWVATDNGLNAVGVRYDRRGRSLGILSWRVYTERDGMPSDEVNDLETDAAGRLWVATEAGLARIEARGEIVVYTTANSGLIDDSVKSLLYDAKGNAVWIGTRSGLSRLQLPEPGTPVRRRVEFHPHPFAVGSGTPLTFSDVVPGSGLRVFTLAGEFVCQRQTEPEGDRIVWNGLNHAGFVVASGIYLFVLEDPFGQRYRGKLAVTGAP